MDTAVPTVITPETKANNDQSKWVTPFKKQCFVTAGVSLNIISHGTALGFSSALIPQLRESKFIILDDSSTSWIVSIVGIGVVTGILIIPFIINKIGRKLINLMSAIIITISWIIIFVAKTAFTLILARCVQGIGNGFTAIIGPILIGEYTSPRNRGAFLATTSASFFVGTALSHTTGSFLSWQKSALICACISFIDILLIICSPESPLYLAKNGKYDACKNNFHWLKGNDEDEELDKMLKNAMIEKDLCKQIKIKSGYLNKILEYILTLRKREFYKPVIIMFHLYTINIWCGVTIHDAFAIDILHTIVGPNVNISLIVFSMDIQAVVINIITIVLIRKFKRKRVLLFAVSLNIIMYLLIASYTYLRVQNILSFHTPIIGIFLSHVHLISTTLGCVSIPNIIAGEIFPFNYKGIGGMFSQIIFYIILTVFLKITPYLLRIVGLSGTYCITAALMCYSLIFLIIMLPETKDRTLQDIENELTGNNKNVNTETELNMLMS
ncbi:uncharacterized protein LOC113513650 [Galleria mellonella]|uniref:Uncharacterized protein LOC113513650 n=1 Tax=Galleria mellonella TaxID=7137 RepID=A0ABM3MP16_GALME|nr:uncharacterized protein LOC113513650 [Galleria mellonella]